MHIYKVGDKVVVDENCPHGDWSKLLHNRKFGRGPFTVIEIFDHTDENTIESVGHPQSITLDIDRDWSSAIWFKPYLE